MNTITLRTAAGESKPFDRSEVQRGLDRGLTLPEIASGMQSDPQARRMARGCRETMREAALMWRRLGHGWLLGFAEGNRDLARRLLNAG